MQIVRVYVILIQFVNTVERRKIKGLSDIRGRKSTSKCTEWNDDGRQFIPAGSHRGSGYVIKHNLNRLPSGQLRPFPRNKGNYLGSVLESATELPCKQAWSCWIVVNFQERKYFEKTLITETNRKATPNMGPKYPRGYATFDTFSFQSAYSPAGTMTLPKNRPALGKQTQQTMGGFPLNRFLVSIMAAAVVNGFIPFCYCLNLLNRRLRRRAAKRKWFLGEPLSLVVIILMMMV